MKIHGKLISAFFAAFLILIASVRAQPSSSVKGEVVEFGIYKSGADTTTKNPDAPTGTRTISKEIEFTERTEKIPGTRGVMFGFRYKLTGLTGEESIELKKVVKHPPFKNKKGELESEYSLSFTRKPKNGTVVSVEGYKLGGGDQLTPGTWTFEIWYQDQKLVSTSFTVVASADAKKK
jgi:Domain of unknown function (DUF3859)